MPPWTSPEDILGEGGEGSGIAILGYRPPSRQAALCPGGSVEDREILLHLTADISALLDAVNDSAAEPEVSIPHFAQNLEAVRVPL